MSTDTHRSVSAPTWTWRDSVGTALAWLATILFVLLAIGTVTMSQPGTPLRLVAGTLIHVALALFAAPPFRHYLANSHGRRFHRSTVAAVLLIGLVDNEGLITPELA